MSAWFAWQAEPNREFVANQSLQSLGVRTFLPWQWTRRLIGHRRCKVRTAYFARYGFCDLQGYYPSREIRSAAGVAKLLGQRPIPEPIMETILHAALPSGEMPKAPLKPGDRILIATLGALVTIEAIDEKDFSVLIPMFGGLHRAKIPRLAVDA
jgi:hypothetical protein